MVDPHVCCCGVVQRGGCGPGVDMGWAETGGEPDGDDGFCGEPGWFVTDPDSLDKGGLWTWVTS